MLVVLVLKWRQKEKPETEVEEVGARAADRRALLVYYKYFDMYVLKPKKNL